MVNYNYETNVYNNNKGIYTTFLILRWTADVSTRRNKTKQNENYTTRNETKTNK